MPGSRDDDRGRPRGPSRGGKPRPPIKGKRRTFDTDSAPNERERARREPDESGTGAGGERWVDEGPVRRAANDAVARGSSGRPSGGRSQKRAVQKRAVQKRAVQKRAVQKRAVQKRDGAPGRGKSGNRPAPARSGGRNDKRRKERATKRAESALEIDRERLVRQLGAAKADRTIGRLGEAADAFADDRYEDARRLLKPLADMVPDEPAIRELHGLTLYRLGRWRVAAAELEAFAERTSTTEQHPVLADCYRALGRHARVAELWEELGAESPDAATVAEGRIVYAGSLADQGRLADAIAVLEAGALGSKKLKHHHLRMRYALGDLYDRAGEHQSARRHFEAVAAAAPDFFDVRERLAQL